MTQPEQPFNEVQIQTGPEPSWAVIWLHGLGADGHDFEPIVPELVRPGWPAIRFVFPHAPVRPVTINNGVPMRAWYDIRSLELSQRADEAGVRESIATVEALIARENARGVPDERIVLAGFSQGGAIALSAAIRHAGALAGVVALSTYLPLQQQAASEAAPANRTLPVFQGHGTADPIVPMALGAQSRDVLSGLGHPVDWRTYPMPHSVCAEEIRDLAAWLQARFVAPQGAN